MDGKPIAQTNRYSAALRKLLSIKGEQHELTYGVHLEEERPEYSFLKQETIWAQVEIDITSAAGTCAFMGIQNPIGSGVLGIINRCWFYAEAAGVIAQLSVGPVAGAGPTPMFGTDTRWGRGAAGALGATNLRDISGATAAFGGHVFAQFVTLAANDPVDVIAPPARVPPIILSPGSECRLITTPVGVHVITVHFAGYQRPLESGELIG